MIILDTKRCWVGLLWSFVDGRRPYRALFYQSFSAAANISSRALRGGKQLADPCADAEKAKEEQ